VRFALGGLALRSGGSLQAGEKRARAKEV